MPGRASSDAVSRVDVGEKEKMLILDSLDGLIDLVQAGVLEIHPWGSTLRASGAAGPADLRSRSRRGRAVERGDRGAPSRCAASSQALGLTSFVKTSGGKGLHVVLPIEPRDDWDEAKAFTQSVAERDGQGAARALRRHDDQERPGAGASSSTICATAAAPPRSRPIRPGRCRSPRCRRRSPGTSFPRASAPTTSRSTTCASASMS